MKTDFKSLYESQLEYQKMITGETLPRDCLKYFCYHIQAMVEELGEVMKADKRWKTHRNIRYVPQEKLDELADVFITAINLAIFSGISEEELYNGIQSKINENNQRWIKEKENKKERSEHE